MTFKEFFKLFEAVPNNITRVVVFDFDDTLVFTPSPEEGIPTYEKETGKPWVINDPNTAQLHGFHKNYKRLGWWGRAETLHPPIFSPEASKLNVSVANSLRGFKDDPQTYTVIMTGRAVNVQDRVKEILATYHIHADEYFFKGQKDVTKAPGFPKSNDTFDFKAFVILNRLMTPNIQKIEIFDDREEHISKFVELGKILKEKWPALQSIIIHDVRQNKNYNL